MSKLKVGDTVPAGTILLMTSGAYSDFGVNGIYRVKEDFIVPGKVTRHGEMAPDIYAIGANPAWVEEVSYQELWRDE